MKQLVQDVGAGTLRLVDVPMPAIGPTEVLVATRCSLVSKGTERAVRELASAGMVGKARARPDLVRQVARKAQRDGVVETIRSVRRRLRADMPLGYAAAGTVVEVGAFVKGVAPGQRVATGGAGHAEFQVVQGPLAVPMPEAVAFEEAAFATVASVVMHALRLAEVGPGSRIGVIGLGLLGQLAVRLGRAAGCAVAAIDVREWSVRKAAEAGAFAVIEAGDDTTQAVVDWTRGRGLDAILLTAATRSSDPIRRAPSIARDRATVVVVGDVGLELRRTPLYEKELTLRFARSYGPGRYDPSYEAWGVDYPIGHVRWTEGRNLEAFLDFLATGRVSVKELITHTFAFRDAAEAYALIARDEAESLGVELTYTSSPLSRRPVEIKPRADTGDGVGLIGAGGFATATLIPAMKRAGFGNFVAVASASGLSAARLAAETGFERVVESADEVINDPDVQLVVVATRHDTHEEFVAAALDAGKHVFCEKPLALSLDGLERVRVAWAQTRGHLMVGFNRRYAPDITAVRRLMGNSGGPLIITYRVNAGRLPAGHWYMDRRQGGRLLGEVCHFIDTCSHIAGQRVSSVFAVGSGREEALLEQDVIVTLRYADGSVATVSYASGGNPQMPKERIEVLGRGRSAVVEDFRTAWLNGKRVRRLASDKGHAAEFSLLRHLIERGTRSDRITLTAFESTAATLAAAQSLLSGLPVSPAELWEPAT